MPTYLEGVNQLTSPSLLGSLRLRIRSDDSYSAAALSAICRVRHGGRLVQRGGAVGDLQGAPRGVEWQRAAHLPALRRRRELGAEAAAFGASQPHAGVVDQRGLVEGDVQAVVGAHGHRRVRGGDLVDWRAVVQVLVAVPLASGDPPRGGGVGERELGQLVVDDEFLGGGLLGELVAETDAVVVDTEHHVEGAVRCDGLGQRRAQLVVVVADVAVLAPGLFPGLIEAAGRPVGEREVALELAAAAQHEAERGGVDDRFAEALDAVAGAAFVQVQLDGQHPVG